MLTYQTTLRINGVDYDEAARVTVGLVVDEWGWDLDGDLECAFHEEGPNTGGIAPQWHAGQLVTLKTAVTLRFFGEIASVEPGFAPGWSFAYRCRGPKYQQDMISVTATDGTGTIPFNLAPEDDDYIPSFAGQEVGQIITYLNTQHATQLTAIGVTTDSTTTSQLAALTLVPPEAVYASGRLGQAKCQVLSKWARNVVEHISAAGKLRYIDTSTAGTTVTLTEGSDPFTPFRFGYSLEDCATRVNVRGKGKIAPFYARLSKSLITAAWTEPNEDLWNWDSYAKPKGAYDTGTVTSVLGASSVRITSDDTSLTHAANFWAGRQAWIHLFNSGGTGLTFSEARPINADTSLSAGGTQDLTLGYDLENVTYTSYAIVGTAGDLASGDLADIWRLFTVTDPGSFVGAHLVKSFPINVPWFDYYGDGYAMTRYPQALIISASGAAIPATFKIVPQLNAIRFDEPVVKSINTPANLAKGGDFVTPPADIYCLIAYSRGALTATYPPDIATVPQYSGTAFTSYGLERTDDIDVDSWVYQGNQSLLDDFAEMMQVSKRDAVYQGTVGVLGAVSACFDPGTTGLNLDIAGSGYTPYQSTIAIPIRSYKLRYVSDGDGGVLYRSQLGCSSKQNPRTGDRYYVHPITAGQLGFKMPSGFDGPGFNAASGSNVGAFLAGQAAGLGVQGGGNIPTSPDQFLPSLADFAALGVDMSPNPAANTMQAKAPAPSINRPDMEQSIGSKLQAAARSGGDILSAAKIAAAQPEPPPLPEGFAEGG